jgi:DNA-binding MarR family transcriptional regulator
VVRAYAALKIDAPFESRGGLTKARYNVLRLLYQSDNGRLPMSDIVQGMQVSPTNITKLVDGLEVDGFARRVDDPEDKRRLHVELLPKGRKVLEETFPLVGQHVNGLWQSMTDEEKKTIIHLLSKLRLHILTWTGSGEASKTETHLSAVPR